MSEMEGSERIWCHDVYKRSSAASSIFSNKIRTLMRGMACFCSSPSPRTAAPEKERSTQKSMHISHAKSPPPSPHLEGKVTCDLFAMESFGTGQRGTFPRKMAERRVRDFRASRASSTSRRSFSAASLTQGGDHQTRRKKKHELN